MTDLDTPQNKFNYDYINNFVNHLDTYYSELMSINWERRGDAPRYEYYCNDHDVLYTYGRGAGERTYYRQAYPHCVLSIRQQLEAKYNTTFDVCFLNRYDTSRDWLGWHADDSPEMDNDAPIITVSLGAERNIEFRHNETQEKQAIHLTNGSMLAMLPGFQTTSMHRIPKVGHEIGPRISLTYRKYKFNENI